MTTYEAGAFPMIIFTRKAHRKSLSGIKLLKTLKADQLRDAASDNEQDKAHLPLPDLPHDLITYHILTRLPIQSLLQYKSISKEWYFTISSNAFANTHFNTSLSNYDASCPVECLFVQAENDFYLFLYEEKEALLDYHLVKLETNFEGHDQNSEFQLVGSCNGLVCLAHSSPNGGSFFYISNPITQDFCKFSDPYLLSSNCKISWGFAYVSSCNDYKVVRLMQDYNTQQTSVHVFSLRTREWKHIPNHGLDVFLLLNKNSPVVLVGDCLHWYMDTKDPSMNPVVVSFNLILEKFEINSDLVARSVSPKNQFLCVLGGHLAMYWENTDKEVYISIQKQPKQVEVLSVSPDLSFRSSIGLAGFTKAGRIFIISKDGKLGLIDPHSSPEQCTPLMTFDKGHKSCMVNFIPSLISPSAFSKDRQ